MKVLSAKADGSLEMVAYLSLVSQKGLIYAQFSEGVLSQEQLVQKLFS